MTLAAAWNSKQGIHFASDSRISKGDMFSDYGVKVTPVHIRIFEPSEECKSPTIAFERIYGMCFSGDFAGAAIIRNFLAVTLQRIQYVPTFAVISFANICKIINKFYSELSIKLQDEIENESIDFFLAGYCPQNRKIMLAKFYIDYGNDINQYHPNSGESSYSMHLDIHKEKSLSIRPIIALKSLIESGTSKSVGGNIQVGSFDYNNDFYMLGIVDETKDEKGHIEKINYYYSGLDMNNDLFEMDNDGFMIIGNYIDPFRHTLPNK